MSSAPVEPMPGSDFVSRFSDLRGVRWRIQLGIFPSSPSSIDDLRRVTADSRRRYAGLRRRLLIDPHVHKDDNSSPDLAMDNPLSQNPDSMWGRYFRNAELEKMVEQDLSRLYPEHGSYFQTPGCQGILRRILLHWCLRYPGYGYRQGMHELLAPLLFVLHSDVQRASEVRNHYEDYFTDKFDDAFFHENDISHDYYDFTRTPDSMHDAAGFRGKTKKVVVSLEELDPSIQTIVSLSDAYGAEGELGIMLSEKFLEHDAYCMFDALLSGAGGAVAMAEFFSHLPAAASQTGLPPVIEASSALYHMLSVVDSSLHSHLVELGVEPQYFALRWFRILFGREFSLEHLLLIWDEIFSLDNSPCPSSDSDQAAENEPGTGSFHGVLNSPRGAFISAMAVSMILSVRSSLLATENATSCLQRLLNFPESVDLMKLLEKAKSLLPVALDANRNPIPYYPLNLPYSENRSKTARVGHSHSHSLSFDSSSPKTPTSSLAERYWEEKWRVVLHKEEELRKDHYTKKQASTTTTTTTPKKSWTEKVRSRLSRTESDPSSSKRANRGKRDHKSSVRRSLLDDLAQKLQLEEDHTGLTEAPESVTFKDPLLAESSVSGKDVQEIIPLYAEKKNRNLGCQRTATGSEENAAEADPESSSLVESPLPISDPPDAYNMSPSGFDSSCESSLAVAAGPSSMNSEERNSLSGGKFDWLWKFAPLQASVERRSESDRGATTTDEGTSSAAAAVSHENNKPPVNMKGNDQNLICSLRSVGQVMLENIQVIETVFQQDRGGGGGGGVGSLDNLSKKNNLVERGQVAALTALKELQKIGNLLSEM